MLFHSVPFGWLGYIFCDVAERLNCCFCGKWKMENADRRHETTPYNKNHDKRRRWKMIFLSPYALQTKPNCSTDNHLMILLAIKKKLWIILLACTCRTVPVDFLCRAIQPRLLCRLIEKKTKRWCIVTIRRRRCEVRCNTRDTSCRDLVGSLSADCCVEIFHQKYR